MVSSNRSSVPPSHRLAVGVRVACLSIAVTSLCLPFWERVARAEQIAAKVSVEDVLTAPGRTATLEARVTREGLAGGPAAGIGGEQVDFLVDGRKAGQTMTGGDGRAFFEYVPRMRGVHPITARVLASPRVRGAEGTARLFAWERRRPILLVETASLAEPAHPRVLPLPGLEARQERKPLDGAAEELNRLAKFYFNVVYLAPSTESHRDQQEWLTRHGFPPGMLLPWSEKPEALEQQIARLREEGWDNLKAGVGRTRPFADALAAQRIVVVIVPPPERGDLPRKTRIAKNWAEVRRHLQG
jgi:hypothetical protein